MSEYEATTTFRYDAQGDDGQRVSGDIDAPGPDTAVARLGAMGLRALHIEPAGAGGTARPLRPDDFLAFNQQLAYLAKAGLPLEQGLRMIGADIGRGRLGRTIQDVADDLERGTPLSEAFDKHRGRFPNSYGSLIDAGIRSGDLAGVLLSLGRHLEMVQRLRGTLWRAMAYPLMVIVALLLVLGFIGVFILPRFQEIFDEFQLRLPLQTQILLDLAPFAPLLLGLAAMIIFGGPFLWGLLRMTGRDAAATDYLVLPLPMVGRVMRLSLVARWCDALRLGVSAGLDLPRAVTLASDATGSPRLRRDGAALVVMIESGAALEPTRLSVLPPTVPAAIEFAAGRHDLPTTLRTLSELYERQAETRLASIPVLLSPLLLILIAVSVGYMISALLVPLFRIINAITGI